MRKLRPPVPGIYHVATRTVDKRNLFPNDYLRVFLLDLVSRVVSGLDWICWSYVLMGTHYHLIVDTPKANLSRGMQFLNGLYGQRYNKLGGRYGHIFSARFWSREITDDDYLKAAIRYVARNPVEAGMCRDAGEWFWSSFGAVIGTTRPPGFLDVRRTLHLFDNSETAAKQALREFVTAEDRTLDVKIAAYKAPL
jgi:REP element-mobilizing transposase RayT